MISKTPRIYIMAIALTALIYISAGLFASKDQIGIIAYEGVPLYKEGSISSEIQMRLPAGLEVEILGKTLSPNTSDYWVRINSLPNGVENVSFDGYTPVQNIKRKFGSSIDWNDIYLRKHYDPTEYKDLFPFEVYPLETVILYTNPELSDCVLLDGHDIVKIMVIWRRERGCPVFTSERYQRIKHYVEVYKVRVLLNALAETRYNQTEMLGWVRADNVIKRDQQFFSPRKVSAIWISNNSACYSDEGTGGDYVSANLCFFQTVSVVRDGNSYRFVYDMGQYLGEASSWNISFSPDSKYVMLGNSLYAINTPAIGSCNFVRAFNQLSSPAWYLEKNKIFLRHMYEPDSVYEYDVGTGKTREIFNLPAEDSGGHLEIGDSLYYSKPVIYDSTANVFTAEFARSTGTYTISFTYEGNIINKTFKSRR